MGFVQGELCGTDEGYRNQAARVLSADSIDISYDGMSRTLIVSALWPSPEGGWTEEIRKRDSGADQVEVGLFGCDQAPDPEELKAGGLIADIGEDEKLSMSSMPESFSYALLLMDQNRHCSPSRLAIIHSPAMRLILSLFLLQPVCIRQ